MFHYIFVPSCTTGFIIPEVNPSQLGQSMVSNIVPCVRTASLSTRITTNAMFCVSCAFLLHQFSAMSVVTSEHKLRQHTSSYGRVQAEPQRGRDDVGVTET